MNVSKSLTNLPPELIINIISPLSISELQALSFVDSTLNQLAERILYRNVEMIWLQRLQARNDYFRQPQFLRIHTLLFSILRVSRRASYVQHLQINTMNLRGIWGFSKTKLTITELSLAKEAISQASVRMHVNERKQWVANLIAGVPNAYIALLLSLVRNIISLDLGSSSQQSGWSSAGLWNNIEHCLPSLYSTPISRQIRVPAVHFVRLQRFRYNIREQILDNNIYTLPIEIEKDLFLPFFNAPSISSVNLYLFSSQDIFTQRLPISTSLTELVLDKYNLGLRQLGKLILATPRLQTLKLDYWVNCDNATDSHKPHLNVPGLFRILYSIRGSLREFQLSTRYWRTVGDCAISYETIKEHGGDHGDPTTLWGHKGSVPSLRDFKQLKVLELPTPVLLGWSHVALVEIAELLPTSLSRLVLRDDLWEWTRYSWSLESLWRELQTFVNCESWSMPELQDVLVTVSTNRKKERATKNTLSQLKHPFKLRETTLNIAIYGDEFTPTDSPRGFQLPFSQSYDLGFIPFLPEIRDGSADNIWNDESELF